MLSVLLPNYNNGPFLKDCLDSVFNQSFQDFVVYFVDDCSTDNSLEIAARYEGEKLVIIKKPFNSGIVDTLNAGLERVRSKYFIRMDGDDICAPDRFEKLVAFMEINPDIDVCTSNIRTFGLSEELVSYEKDVLQNKANLIFSHTIGHPSSIFRTRVLKDSGISYKNDYWRMEDYQLFYRLKDIAKYSCLPEPLYFYRRGEYNLNEEIRQRKVGEFKRFYRMIFEDMEFDFSDDDVATHVELAGYDRTTKPFSVYKDHARKILRANQKKMIFPQKQLAICLDRALTKMCFWQIDLSRLSFSELLPFAWKDRNLFRYYFAKKRSRQRVKPAATN